MKKISKVFCLLVWALLQTAGAHAQTALGFTFSRTGTNAASVEVKATDALGNPIEGITAQFQSSHALKATGNAVTEAVVCPNVNGNTNPTIVLTLTVSGLASPVVFDEVGLDLHALNASGAYQNNSDGKARRFNIDIKQGSDGTLTPFADFQDIDIAAGIGSTGDVHGVWKAVAPQTSTAEGQLVLQMTITAGSTNTGCFIGLSGITLGLHETTQLPPTGERSIYNIVWKNTASYMNEEADGTLVVSDYDTSRRCFWEFIPTENENCYYIRNTATGRFIASSNRQPSSASIVKTTDTPVEYYVGSTAATAGDISGCVWLSSTDCENYADESSSPRALNKDGGSSNVIVYPAGTTHPGSYWKLVATEDLYEVRPFATSPEEGEPAYRYNLWSDKGLALEMSAEGKLSWQPKNENAAQEWYFVGTSNHDGGYLVMNAGTGQAVASAPGEATRWSVFQASTENPLFFFRQNSETDQTPLSVEGDSLLTFHLVRSSFARSAQIYELPCGNLVGPYITKATVSGASVLRPMVYPLPVLSNGELTEQPAPQPDSYYTLYTHDKATLRTGEGAFDLHVELSEAPAEGTAVYAYLDWNGDGLFEVAQPLTAEQSIDQTFAIPADAVAGKSRLRLRITQNGLTEADDEVTGQVVDFVLLKRDADAADLTAVSVRSVDDNRGSAELSELTENEGTALATPKGNASFICWREADRIVSVDASYSFRRDHNIRLTAYFSPNTQVNTGIKTAGQSERNVLVEVSKETRTLRVMTEGGLHQVLVFSPSGALVAKSCSASLSTKGWPAGPYIVKIFTGTEDLSSKVIVE